MKIQKQKYNDVLDLVKLGYFKLTADGRGLVYTGKERGFIDFHTHIGGNYFLGRPIDWWAKPEVKTFFPISGAEIDLNHYSALDYDPNLIKKCRLETVKPMVINNGLNRTHTLLNLTESMNNLGFEKAVVLPVDLVTSRNSQRLQKEANKLPEQILPFASVHPLSPFAGRKLINLARKGAKGVKLHPTVQMIRPANKRTIELVRRAGKLNLPVIFHCGNTPLSPPLQKRFNRMTDFEICIKEAPDTNIILGHAGTVDYKEAIKLAEKYPRVFLELSGQPPQAIREMITAIGDERLLFGSDWPYYPVALPMAKVLLATEGKPVSRKRIMGENARRLLGV